MKKVILVMFCVTILLATVLFASCSPATNTAKPEETTSEQTEAKPEATEQTAAELVGMNIEVLEDDGTGAILPIGDSPGPQGETPVGVDAILNLISDEKAEEIRNAGYTAAVSLHTTASDWSILQLQGIQTVMDEFNIELLTVTDAEMSVDKQVSDLESIIALNPDMILSFVLDGNAVAQTFKDATAKGIVISLIDSVPAGFKSPENYAGMGTADNYANGAAAAEKLAEYMEFKGKVAMLNYVTSLFHTDARSQGARDTFAKYPDIEVVVEQGVDGAETAASATESILTANPDIKGMWTVWDAPGMGAVGVIESMNSDVKVVTVDLSEDTAYSIATGGAMLATGAQHPYDQGIAEAMIGVAGLAGIETPSYVLVPGEIVTKESMEASWSRVFKTDIPADMAEILKK